MNIKTSRVERLKAFVANEGGAAKLARKYEGIDASYISQLINSHRPFGEKSARRIEELCQLPYLYFDFFDGMGKPTESEDGTSSIPMFSRRASQDVETYDAAAHQIELHNNPEYPAIRRVNLELSAGVVGYTIEYDVEDKTPINFSKNWFVSRGYKPERLVAVAVKNESMLPGISDGDTVVINLDDTKIVDGKVYAVNYEGEQVIKRLIRDAGEWWLSSDNPDQKKYARKLCGSEYCIIIGRIVHKQSEEI